MIDGLMDRIKCRDNGKRISMLTSLNVSIVSADARMLYGSWNGRARVLESCPYPPVMDTGSVTRSFYLLLETHQAAGRLDDTCVSVPFDR